MDPRLEFVFQLLMDATQLPRSELMDYVFESNMLDEINQVFLPHMRNKLMWFYQEVPEPEPAPQPEQNKGARGANVVAAVVAAAAGAVPKATAAAGAAGGAGPSGSGGGGVAGGGAAAGAVAVPAASKKRLFLTDGWQAPLTGLCVYIFRLNPGKGIPDEGFHKDLLCGVLDAERVGLVAAVQRVMERVFMQALAHPAPDAEEDDAASATVRSQLLPGLRSFCSALRVCEEVCGLPNLFDDGRSLAAAVRGPDDARELVRSPERLAQLEERVKGWMRRVQEVLMESEQLRRECDASGPQDELEYWKRRGAQFSQLVAQLRAPEVRCTLLCLAVARAKVLRIWRDTDRKITYCYNEARDNAKYIQCMEKCCHSLYLHDPVRMKDCVLSLLQTVRLIHNVSQYYNTSERTSSLMVKITSQMIDACRQYVTARGRESIWSQPRAVVRQRLVACLRLNAAYRSTYAQVKAQPFLPGQESFGFSESYVFGKFDSFCGRISGIVSLFDQLDDFSDLFESRMEGLLLGEALEEAELQFEEARAGVTGKPYDYLDPRCADFDADLAAFMGRAAALKDTVAQLIEHNFRSVWETPQGIRFLTRFEKVSRKLPLARMEDKYARVLGYCEREVERAMRVFRRQKEEPPLARHFPPLAGRLSWARSLRTHITELVAEAAAHPALGSLPQTADLQRRHAAVASALQAYEEETAHTWLTMNVSSGAAHDSAPLINAR